MPLLRRKPGVARGAARPEDFEILNTDPWTRVADDAPLEDGHSLVSWARSQRDREALLSRAQSTGVIIPNDLSESELERLLPFALIAIQFPKFRDGRGFTFARWLRSRWNYQGELRAVGDVLRDQLLFMHRTGFDSFELREGKDPKDALGAFAEQSAFYQASSDLPAPLWKRTKRESP